MKRLTLWKKLLLSYLAVILISLTGVGVFSYRASSIELERLAHNQLIQAVGNAVHHTDLYISTYERSIISLLTSRDVQQFVDLPEGERGYPYYEQRKLIKELSVDPIFIRNPEIARILLISYNGNAVYFYNSSSEASFNMEETRRHLNFFLENTAVDGTLSVLNYSVLSEEKNDMLTLVRRIRGLSSPENKAILAIELRAAELEDMWKGIDLGEKGYFFIVDDKGRYVYHPHPERIGTVLPEGLQLPVLKAEGQVFTALVDEEEHKFMSQRSSYGSWRLVVSIPSAELQRPAATIRTTTLTVGFFTLGLAVWLAVWFGKSITTPIFALKKAMRKTEKGNWSIIPLPQQEDEITELMRSYNLMVNRLSELVDKVYQAELRDAENRVERQRAELQSLQLQINPHFLYNTLETIVCYAVIQDSHEITDIVKDLAYMLRYSVQTDLEEITVVNELRHTLAYMNVLRHRIGREFELEVALHSDYLLRTMVRLTLQPLVENIFHHAFADGIEDYHYVRIDGGEVDGRFWISVEDNGSGMEPETLARLQEQLETNRLPDKQDKKEAGVGGIGVINVHRRIQMVFGEGYGLRVESRRDEGTRVIMLMPTDLKEKPS